VGWWPEMVARREVLVEETVLVLVVRLRCVEGRLTLSNRG